MPLPYIAFPFPALHFNSFAEQLHATPTQLYSCPFQCRANHIFSSTLSILSSPFNCFAFLLHSGANLSSSRLCHRISTLSFSLGLQVGSSLCHCFSKFVLSSLFPYQSMIIISVPLRFSAMLYLPWQFLTSLRLYTASLRQRFTLLLFAPAFHDYSFAVPITTGPLRLKPCYCTTSSQVKAPFPEFRH